MKEKILLVDDDQNILAAYSRQLRRRYDISTALGGEEALEAIRKYGPYAVILTDMRMPVMDGIQLLTKVREVAPMTVRLMLTGNADQQTAIDAINEGAIFRFFTKPCPRERLEAGLDDAIRQYRLQLGEKDLVEKTLAGSIKVLVDVLAIADPAAFGQTRRLQNWAKKVSKELKLANRWELAIAALLSPIGQITLTDEIKRKLAEGKELTAAEQEVLNRYPYVARDLIVNIPRLNKIAEAIFYQNKGFDGSGIPNDSVAARDLPVLSRILKILSDLLPETAGAEPDKAAFDALEKRAHLYDPDLLQQIRGVFLGETEEDGKDKGEIRQISLVQLQPGYRLVTNIETTDGQLLLAAGQYITMAQLEKLRGLQKLHQIKEPIHALCVDEKEHEAV